MTTVVLDNHFASVVFHEDSKIVHHTYKPDMEGGQALKDVLNAGTEALQENNGEKWLSDNRALHIEFSESDADWVNNEWLPRTVDAGWKYWAMVVPDSVMAQADHIKYIESFYGQDVRCMVFDNLDEAMDWLINVDKA